ncbi:MAG: preprotein translocase subunit YajC [Flavobacteriales bacterium]|nr:preprotein translocase subunit YajC [Flavobacteriales bacterium]
MELLYTILMAPQGQEGNPAVSFMFIGGFILVFYFFMIRPQQKKAKTQKSFRSDLKKGDKIVTIGGIHGKIVDVKDNTLTVQIDANSKLKIEKSAVSMEMTKGVAATSTSTAEALPAS